MSNPFGSNSKVGSDFVFRYTAGKKGDNKDATYEPRFLHVEKSDDGNWVPCKDHNGRDVSFTSLKGYVYGSTYRVPDDPAHTDSFLVFMSTEPNGMGLKSSVRFSLGSTGWNVLNALAHKDNWFEEQIELSVYVNRKSGYASISIRNSEGEYAPTLLGWDDFRALWNKDELPEKKIRENARKLHADHIAPLHEGFAGLEQASASRDPVDISATTDDDDLPF